MQTQKGITSVILVVVIVVLVVAAGFFAYQYFVSKTSNQPQVQNEQQNQNQQQQTVNANVNALKDSYSFNAVEVQNPDEKYPNESIEIYKNQQLVKTIDIKNTYVKPSLFVLSPDQKYFAFRVAIYGGTCVYVASPMVVDLSDFSIVNLDNSDIKRKISSALGIDISKVIKFSATQEINDIKWISNNEIETTMQFGDNTGCPIIYANKPANSLSEINVDVDFTIVK